MTQNGVPVHVESRTMCQALQGALSKEMAWFGGRDSDMGEVEPKSLVATQILSATSSDCTGALLTPRQGMESGKYKTKTNCWVCKTWEEEERKAWQREEGRKKGEIQKGREERRKERG